MMADTSDFCLPIGTLRVHAVVDFSGVAYLSSVGLRSLVGRWKKRAEPAMAG
jgi:anti-anti-sigma regulatory factor